MTNQDTHINLEDVAQWYSTYQGLNGYMIKCVFDTFLEKIRFPLLEVGAADGYMTSLIQEAFPETTHTIVEASKSYSDLLKSRFPNHAVACSYLEEYSADKTFATIIISHVLEHVRYPIRHLRAAKNLLSSDGLLLISVPNAQSIHRLLGVEMGLLNSPGSLSESDKKIGHYRVYSPELLSTHVRKAGMEVVEVSTRFIKFLSNGQTEAQFPEKDWKYFDALSKHFPKNGADLIMVARRYEEE